MSAVRSFGGRAMTRYWQRREFVTASLGLAGGLLGDGLIGHVPAAELSPRRTGKSVIYIFLSGGLSQLDSFDLKPEAPVEIRGEFRPVATATPGIHICEHLPRLAQ